jgi:hypothetical protein
VNLAVSPLETCPLPAGIGGKNQYRESEECMQAEEFCVFGLQFRVQKSAGWRSYGNGTAGVNKGCKK